MWNKEHNSIYDYTSSDIITRKFEIISSNLFTKRKDQLKIYRINPYPLDFKEEQIFEHFAKYMDKEVIKEIGINEEEILTEIHIINSNEVDDKYKIISQNKSLYYQYMKIQYFKEQGYYSNLSNWICIGKSELAGNNNSYIHKSNSSQSLDYVNSSNLYRSYYDMFPGDIIKLGKVMFKIIEINSDLRPEELNSYKKKLSTQNYARKSNSKCKEVEELRAMIQESINPNLKLKSKENIIGKKKEICKKQIF